MSTFSGIIIGLLAGSTVAVVGRSRSNKEIDRLKMEAQNLRDELSAERRKSKQQDPEKEYVPADMAFKDNLNKFVPLLKGVSKQEITNRQKWTEAIVSINNEELTDLWMAANNRPELWMTYLQTFGLQIDLVDSFEAAAYHAELYDDLSHEDLKIGQKYKVESSCWIYTDDNNEKSVVCKGTVSKL